MDSNREAYIKKAEAQLKEWEAQIDLLKAKGKNLAADGRLEFNKQIEEIDKKRAELSNYLDQLADKSEDLWEDIKDEAEEKWQVVSNNFSDFFSKFK
ncbi:MAG: coiled coil domain-containing protein [Nitrosomonas sp.]|nr:coiled coil domain-containing protein [Nitrosomonas sp.]MBX3640874.1 coiled coil domain-containing protein [Nitrosomonas sp.]